MTETRKQRRVRRKIERAQRKRVAREARDKDLERQGFTIGKPIGWRPPEGT